jgi:serine/threonine protein phosphatase PrpC
VSTLVAHVAAITHPGLVRSNNEDIVAVNDWICTGGLTEPQVTSQSLDKPIALIVCDGMGGHGAGEIASDLAVKHLSTALKGTPTPEAIEQAVVEANQKIFDAATDPALQSMGTTVAGLWLSEQGSLWFNVGDSSVFRFANGFVLKLSLDDVDGEDRSGAVTQALGGASHFVPVDVHFGDEVPRPGWSYLICSDGLTDMVPLHEIERLMMDGSFGATARLFEAAIQAGAEDNLSIIVAAIADATETEPEAS